MEEEQQLSKAPITITIDPMALDVLKREGGELVLKPDAEKAIMAISQWQQQCEAALDIIKTAIEAAGLTYDPHFQSVQGDYVKVTYQDSGAIYAYDPEKIRRYNAPFFKTKMVRALDSTAIAEFEERNNGRLPTGVFKPKRRKNVVIRIKKGA